MTELPQIILILCGLPGSGKTVLAQALEQHSADSLSRWVRASQDDAPSRRRQECEAVVQQALADGHSVVVDRVGFDPTQRSHFIRIARKHHPQPLIYVLTLHTSQATLSKRLKARTSHPTLTSPEVAARVLGQMLAVFDPPRPGRVEGFDRVMELREENQPKDGIWSGDSLQRLIRDIGRAHQELVLPPPPQQQGSFIHS